MILYVKCGNTFSRNRRQHVIVRHRMLQTVEEGGIYVEISDKMLSYVVLRYETLYVAYHCADNSLRCDKSVVKRKLL